MRLERLENILNKKEMVVIRRFKYLPHILIGVLGLSVAGTSFYFLNNRYVDPVEMKEIVVTAREVSMYEVIRSDDVKNIQVPVDTDTGDYLVNLTNVLGKVSKMPLMPNELISPDSLLDKKEVENIAFITINTLYAKTGGAKPGDIVDVLKVNQEKGDWVEGNQTTLVAEDVIVVSVSTANGKSLGEGSRMPLGGSDKVEVVKLGIKPEDAKYLAPASALVDNGYVLIVKSSYSQEEDLGRDSNLNSILKENKEEDEEGGALEDGENIDENVSKEGDGAGNLSNSGGDD